MNRWKISRNMAGLALCIVLSILSLYRQSFNTHSVKNDPLVFKQASVVGTRIGLEVGLSPSEIRHKPDLWQDTKSPSMTSSLRITKRVNDRDSIRNELHKTRPRVLSLTDSHPESKSYRSIFHGMVALLAENNPMSASKDSSAVKRKEIGNIHALEVMDKGHLVILPSNGTISNLRMELMGKAELVSSTGKDPLFRGFEKDWYENCIPVTEGENKIREGNTIEVLKWKNEEGKHHPTLRVRSTCNSFHELDVSEAYTLPEKHDIEGRIRIELLGEGSWRSVWKVFESIPSSLKYNGRNISGNNLRSQGGVVLKLLHTHHKFDENSYSIHELDSMVMEALSSSKYIVDSYGFCGQSVITAAAQQSGRSLIKHKELQWIDRIRIARDLARGLADLHAFHAHDYGGDPTTALEYNNLKSKRPQARPLVFAHHDVNPANLIGVHPGQIQWNDFNLGLINRYHSNNGELQMNRNYSECPTPIRYEQLLWRSPEECRNQTGVLMLDLDGSGRNTAAQAADVYSLGNILFYVLARHQPWSHLEEVVENSTVFVKLDTGSTSENKRQSIIKIGEAKVNGKLPNLPDRYLKRKEAKLLWKAVEMCYEYDPSLRPKALDIAGFLGETYEKLYTKHRGRMAFTAKNREQKKL